MNDNALATLYTLYLADEPMTTTELAKSVFEPEDTEATRNADRKVRHYLEESHPDLVKVVEHEGTKHFTVRNDRVWFGMGMTRVVTLEGDEVELGLGEVMMYNPVDDEPQTVSIEFGEDEDDAENDAE